MLRIVCTSINSSTWFDSYFWCWVSRWVWVWRCSMTNNRRCQRSCERDHRGWSYPAGCSPLWWLRLWMQLKRIWSGCLTFDFLQRCQVPTMSDLEQAILWPIYHPRYSLAWTSSTSCLKIATLLSSGPQWGRALASSMEDYIVFLEFITEFSAGSPLALP